MNLRQKNKRLKKELEKYKKMTIPTERVVIGIPRNIMVLRSDIELTHLEETMIDGERLENIRKTDSNARTRRKDRVLFCKAQGTGCQKSRCMCHDWP